MPPDQAAAAGLRSRLPGYDRNDVSFLARHGKGWLIGTNAGEWGGGLYFFPDAGPPVTLIEGNVVALFRHGQRIYAVTGLAHLILDDGDLWELEVRGDNFRVDRRIRLPGAPFAFAVTSDGLLLIRTASGDVALSGNGSLREPSCQPASLSTRTQ